MLNSISWLRGDNNYDPLLFIFNENVIINHFFIQFNGSVEIISQSIVYWKIIYKERSATVPYNWMAVALILGGKLKIVQMVFKFED